MTHGSLAQQLKQAQHRICDLEKAMVQRSAVMAAAVELGRAELAADRLLFSGRWEDGQLPMQPRLDAMDRLAAAERAMGKAAKKMAESHAPNGQDEEHKTED